MAIMKIIMKSIEIVNQSDTRILVYHLSRIIYNSLLSLMLRMAIHANSYDVSPSRIVPLQMRDRTLNDIDCRSAFIVINYQVNGDNHCHSFFFFFFRNQLVTFLNQTIYSIERVYAIVACAQ
jgi:hypothetical protein